MLGPRESEQEEVISRINPGERLLTFLSLRCIINVGKKDRQKHIPLAIILCEFLFGIFLVGLFYTFCLFLIGQPFAAIFEYRHEHDVTHEAEHDVEHCVEHDVENDSDHDMDHDIEHTVEPDDNTHVGIGHAINHNCMHDVDIG